MTRPAGDCHSLIPEAWLQPTPGAPLPLDGSTGAQVVFGEAQTGRLEVANGEKVGGFEIVRKCEAREAAIVARIQRPWWKFWQPGL